jgi:hypothetical protein
LSSPDRARTLDTLSYYLGMWTISGEIKFLIIYIIETYLVIFNKDNINYFYKKNH